MIGTTIRNFIFKRVLGAGGMGTVYYAEHVDVGADNARVFKVLRPELTSSKTVVDRFLNEARAARKIKSKNIVHVLDWGQLGNSWWIEMEWKQGVTLAQFIDAHQRPLPEPTLVHIGLEIANGLIDAHKAKVLHRDLKPENVWLPHDSNDPYHVEILDFGVAKLLDQDLGLTVSGQPVGTYAYMAPEALNGGQATPAVDTWALGAVLYQMATGGWSPYQQRGAAGDREDYRRLTPAVLYERQRTSGPVDPRHHNSMLRESIALVILRALHFDPEQRFKTARELGLALAEALPGDGFHPSGLDLAHAYAPNVLEVGSERPTLKDSHTPVPPPPPSTSPYQLGRLLGKGGMAEVYLGSVIGIEGFARQVAIKRVLSEYSKDQHFRVMFIDEARNASLLVHQNVVSVTDFNEDPDGRPFLVMEFVPGKDLNTLLEHGPLPASIAIFVLTEMLRGLGHAHARHLLHRDVSPHNVLLSWDGGVKVSDFGIAKALDARDGGARSLVIKGKPAYMSPEQVDAETLYAPSDLYAVGIIAWEVLTGRRLYSGTMNEIFRAIREGTLPKPSTVRPVRPVPRDLEAVVMKLLARDQRKRYQNAEEAIDALAACADNPRNGRSQLARLLAERFPQEVQAYSEQGASKQGGTVTAVEQPASARPATPHVPGMSTLAGAASQSIGHAPSRRRRQVSGAIAAALVIGGATATALLLHSGTRGSDAVAQSQPVDAQLAPATAPVVQVAGTATPIDAAVPVDAAAVVAVDAPLPLPDAAAAAVAHLPSAASTDAAADARHAAGTTSAEPAPVPKPAAKGQLRVYVAPWAEVVVDGRIKLGQTPVIATLPVGPHRVLLKNAAKQETITVNIAAGKSAVIDETW
ncbi:MAG TPA: serine/threonine-protein kinase [Kofleriaceae bacterium]|jgi:serine/threonine protein kinase